MGAGTASRSHVFTIFSFALAKLNNWVCPLVRSSVCSSSKPLHLDIVVWAQKSSEKNYVWKNLTLRDFFKKNIFFFDLSWDYILVKEHGCMYGLMNGANSDNAVSIQKMVNQITFTLLHGDMGHSNSLGSACSLPPFLLNWVVSHQETHPKGRGHAQIFGGEKEIVVGAKKALKKTMSGKIWHLENFRFFFQSDSNVNLCIWTYRLSTKSSEKNNVWKNLTLRDFFKKKFPFFFLQTY